MCSSSSASFLAGTGVGTALSLRPLQSWGGVEMLGRYKKTPRKFPGEPVADTVLPPQEAWVQSLVRELRSCMPWGTAKKGDS